MVHHCSGVRNIINFGSGVFGHSCKQSEKLKGQVNRQSLYYSSSGKHQMSLMIHQRHAHTCKTDLMVKQQER